MDAVEDIKQKLNIEDVIGEYVQLKRAGRNFKGLSPFTNEKTPSLMVSPEKQIWHDFSSGKGGNMFSFVMEMEALDFKGALELLARKAGVDIEKYRGSGNDYNAKLKNRILEALELAAKFYQTQLVANSQAVNYVKARQISKNTLIAWRIGYAPNTGRALATFLTKHGFSVEEMKRAGLAVERSRGVGDMFRGRLVIPLCDQSGSVVGFTARIIDESEPNAPKYINTPQTMVYDKSRHIFGLHLAKERIRKDSFVVVVEGNMDVIASWQSGVTNVVATAGTAVTEGHLKVLKRFTADVRLCFDADQAGISATERAIPLAQKAEVQLSIIDLSQTGAKDPDELIHTDVHLWETALSTKQYAVDWLIVQLQVSHDITSAVGKRNFTDIVLPTIARLSDPVEKEHYINLVANLTGSSIEAIESKLVRQPNARTILKKSKKEPAEYLAGQADSLKLQDHLLAILFFQPAARTALEDLNKTWFADGEQRQLLEFLKTNPAYKGGANPPKEVQKLSDYVKVLSLQFEQLYQEFSADEQAEQVEQLRLRVIKQFVENQKRQLSQKIEQTTDSAELDRLLSRADKLNKLLSNS